MPALPKWLNWLSRGRLNRLASRIGFTREHPAEIARSVPTPDARSIRRRLSQENRWCATPDLMTGRLKRGPTVWIQGLPCGQLYDPNDEESLREAGASRRKVIFDFINHLSHRDPASVSQFWPIEDLPHPKGQIRDALLSELEVTGDFRAWNGIHRSARALARFQNLTGADAAELEQRVEDELSHWRWATAHVSRHRKRNREQRE